MSRTPFTKEDLTLSKKEFDEDHSIGQVRSGIPYRRTADESVHTPSEHARSQPKTLKEKQIVSFNLDKALVKALKKQAAKESRSSSNLLQLILREGLKQRSLTTSK